MRSRHLVPEVFSHILQMRSGIGADKQAAVTWQESDSSQSSNICLNPSITPCHPAKSIKAVIKTEAMHSIAAKLLPQFL